jgi:3-hydroxyacyl-CoA dehydrogenase
MQIKVVTIIGANGTMGTKVSGIFASFGDARVHMVCRNIEDAKKAVTKASLSVKAEAIAVNLIPATYDDLEDCIPSSDLVFESVAEDIEIKKNINSRFEPLLKDSTIIGTGTSGLSINELSKSFRSGIRKNYMGIHMYNPPYNMILCEVIPADSTNMNVLADMKNYLSARLRRKVVEVKDTPAFLGNRIGFQFINEAMQYAELYRDSGGIDYIDAILGPFTGRSMPPLATSDFVGLDVHKAIVKNIYENTEDYAHKAFKLPDFVRGLIKEGNLGRKTGAGLFKALPNSDGSKTIQVFDIATGSYRPREKYVFPFAVNMISELRQGNYRDAFKILVENHSIEASICVSFLSRYALYGISMAKLLGEGVEAADDVMAMGYNWVPPLGVIDAFGGVDTFKNVVRDRADKKDIQGINIDALLSNLPPSNYDYRPFFKAR